MQDPQTTAYFYLVTVNPVFWTVLRPGPCSSFGGGPPKTDCWRGAAAVGHSRAAQQHPEATQLVVGSCWPAATNPSQCVAHSWQQPSPGESTHSHQCCQLHLISPSLSFHVLSPCAYNTLLFVYTHCAGLGSPLPHSSSTIHHSSASCSLLPRSLPTHKPKYPHAVPILTSSSCFPNLPHCWLAASAPLLILPGSSTLSNGPCSLLSKPLLSSQHSCHSNTFWT